MKTKAILLSVVLLFTAFNTFAKEDSFAHLTDREDIAVVEVTKSLLAMMAKDSNGSTKIKGLELDDMINKLENIRVFNTESTDAIGLIKDAFNKEIKSNENYEKLMQMKDGDESVIFYAEKQKNSDKISTMLLLVSEPDEAVLIEMKGNFTMEDLKAITENIK